MLRAALKRFEMIHICIQFTVAPHTMLRAALKRLSARAKAVAPHTMLRAALKHIDDLGKPKMVDVAPHTMLRAALKHQDDFLSSPALVVAPHTMLRAALKQRCNMIKLDCPMLHHIQCCVRH